MADKTLTAIASFGDQASGSALIVAEIDSQVHQDADGNVKSVFLPGDEVFFLLHYDASVAIVRVLATDGGDVQRIGQVTRSNTLESTFQHPADLVDLPHRPNGQPDVKWFGRSGSLLLSGRSLRTDAAPCLGEISYNFTAMQYRHRLVNGIVLQPGEAFPVDVVVEYRVD